MQKNSFTYEELITCGKGDLFGEGNAKLPLPPMLMFDRITKIDNNSGEFKKGFIKAELDIKENLWFFGCHFQGDPATGKPIGETKANLASAVAGETHEYTDMYPGMAKTARDEGFDEIADWFETLAKAEKSHAGKFQKTLESIK